MLKPALPPEDCYIVHKDTLLWACDTLFVMEDSSIGQGIK